MSYLRNYLSGQYFGCCNESLNLPKNYGQLFCFSVVLTMLYSFHCRKFSEQNVLFSLFLQTSDYCVISGSCYTNTTFHPDDPCYHCDPSSSTNQWTLYPCKSQIKNVKGREMNEEDASLLSHHHVVRVFDNSDACQQCMANWRFLTNRTQERNHVIPKHFSLKKKKLLVVLAG